jgi:FG-GAP repeat
MKSIKLFLSICTMLLCIYATAQNVGINNTNPQAALDLNGDLRLRSTILTLPVGVSHDVDLTTTKSSVYMFAGGALTLGGFQISGFTGGVDGRIVTILNNSTQGALQLYDANFSASLSTPTNKIVTGTGKNAVIYNNGSVTMRYDGAIQKWTIIASNYVDGLSASPSPWLINGNNIYNTNTNNIGMGVTTPTEKLDVLGNIKTTGEIKPNGIAGQSSEVLTSNGNGTMQWAAAKSGDELLGAGTWGDCTMGNITGYFPVANQDGQAGAHFGQSVAISGDYAIVGAPDDNEGGFTGNGSAVIFKKNAATGAWEQQGAKLINPSPANGDAFGISVAISGDYAIVGAYYDSEGVGLMNNGSSTVYKRNATTGTWEPQGNKLINANASSQDYFGGSVAISGDYAIVGAYYDDEGVGLTNNGSATVFKRNSSTGAWEQQGSKLVNANPLDYDRFGGSVSISGDYAIVGCSDDDEGGLNNNGSATIYKRNTATGVWEQQGNKLLNGNPANGDYFGGSVSISGDYIVVGAFYDEEFGVTYTGSATIFKRNITTGAWNQQGGKLLNANPAFFDLFGMNVSISGDYVIVGAFYDDESGLSNNGSATVFKRVGSIWMPLQKIINPRGASNDLFGIGTSIDNNGRFLIGAYGVANNIGMAFFGKVK